MDPDPADVVFTITPRDERTYVCEACGKPTTLRCAGYLAVFNPYSDEVMAACSQCVLTHIDNLSWRDTGEPVLNYRTRIGSYCPAWLHTLWIWLPLVLAAVGAGIGFLTRFGYSTDIYVIGVWAACGAIAGLPLGYALRPMLLRYVLGVPPWYID